LPFAKIGASDRWRTKGLFSAWWRLSIFTLASVTIRSWWGRSWRFWPKGSVAPLLNDWLLDLPGVGPAPAANLFWDVDAVLAGLQQRHQLRHVLALPLGLKRTTLLRHILDDSFLLLLTLLCAWLYWTGRWSTQLEGDFLAFGLWRVLLDSDLVDLALVGRPLGALLLCGVALGNILALLLISLLALGNVILDIVLVVPGCALRLVFGGTLGWSGGVAIPDERRVTEFDLLFQGSLLVLDETPLLKSFVTFLLLLRLKIRGVGKMTLLAVAVLAVNLVIVFGLFCHDNFVDTPFSGSRDGPDIKGNVIATSLPGEPAVVNQLRWLECSSRCSEGSVIVVAVMMGVIVIVILAGVAVEWESVPEGFSVTGRRHFIILIVVFCVSPWGGPVGLDGSSSSVEAGGERWGHSGPVLVDVAADHCHQARQHNSFGYHD